MQVYFDHGITVTPQKRPNSLFEDDIWDIGEIEEPLVAPDVQHYVPESSDEEICFGSIIDVLAQLRSIDGISQYDQPNQWQSFSVSEEGDYFALELFAKKVARLNKGICKQLCKLLNAKELPKVRLRAYAEKRHWSDAIRSWQSHNYSSFPVELNLYGPRSAGGNVGRLLSKFEIFLQYPKYGTNGIDYCNPQLLKITGYPSNDSHEFAESTSADIFEDSGDFPLEESQTNDTKVVDDILNSLSHNVNAEMIRVDQRIKTKLLPHQKEAMDFISQCENGQVPDNLSLWKYNNLDADTPFYEHAFSGAKCPKPEEAKGGIIADEMGLGKSLVILSTIAGSLEKAEEFFTSQTSLRQSNPQTRIPSKATLIVAPSSLLIDNWVGQIREHVHNGGLPFHKHIGSSRHDELDFLRSREIVFSTYATIASEFKKRNTLFDINWFRIVLDEAHDIRNRDTKQFRAVADLTAQHRWCLTGTPIQNSLEDLGALISFLKVPILENPPTFRKFIINPVISKQRNRFNNLRLLLKSTCIRRERDILGLPDPEEEKIYLPFTEVEAMELEDLVRQCITDIDRAVSTRKRINSTFLLSLLRLRLYCNNGSADIEGSTHPTGLPKDADEALTILEQSGENICAYCQDTIYSIDDSKDTDGGTLMSSCFHLICRSCMPQQNPQKQKCPACEIQKGLNRDSLLASDGFQNLQSDATNNNRRHRAWYPTKLLRLLSDLQKDRYHKCIVFSSWKKTLTLVGELLDSNGVRYQQIDGTLSLPKRIKVLKDFSSPIGANILLMTLGTGAVGLNLAIASRIYLLEPQWNPSIESQAIGRALRLGQTQQVKVIRYIMIGSVEESNVLFRQQKKLQLAGGGFGKKTEGQSERFQAMKDYFDERIRYS